MERKLDMDERTKTVGDDELGFQFKFYSQDKLNEIVKRVQQDKRKEREELEWKKYMCAKEMADQATLIEATDSSDEDPDSSQDNENEDECSCDNRPKLFYDPDPPGLTTRIPDSDTAFGLEAIAEEAFIEDSCSKQAFAQEYNSSQPKHFSERCRTYVHLPVSGSSSSVRAEASKTSLNGCAEIVQSKVQCTPNCLPKPLSDNCHQCVVLPSTGSTISIHIVTSKTSLNENGENAKQPQSQYAETRPPQLCGDESRKRDPSVGSGTAIGVRAVTSKTKSKVENPQNNQQQQLFTKKSQIDVARNLSTKSKVPTQRGEGMNKKSIHSHENKMRIRSFWRKMNVTLDKISLLFDKIPNPDDVADYNRRSKRATDFSSMFGRNYLYPLGRKISDLHDLVATIVGSVPSVVYKHLVDAHQISSTALVSYLSHMPSSVIAGVPDKLQKLLTSILDLCQLCDKLAMSAEEGEGLEDGSDEGSDAVAKKCEEMLLVLQEKEAEVPAPVTPRPKQKKLPTQIASKPKDVTTKKSVQNKMSSPYLVTMLTKGAAAKPLKNLARKRFGPPPLPRKIIKPAAVLRVKNIASVEKKPSASSISSSDISLDDDEDEEEEDAFPNLVQNYSIKNSCKRHNVSNASTVEVHMPAVHMSAHDPASDAVENSVEGAIGSKLGEMCQEELLKKIIPVLSEMKEALSRSRQQPNEISANGMSLEEQLKYLLQHMDLPDTQQQSTVDSKSTKNEQNQQAKVVRVGSNNAQLIVLPAYNGPECTTSQHQLDETGGRQCIISDISTLAGTFAQEIKQKREESDSILTEHLMKTTVSSKHSDAPSIPVSEAKTLQTLVRTGNELELVSKPLESKLHSSNEESKLQAKVAEKEIAVGMKDEVMPCMSHYSTALEISDQSVLSVLEYVNNYREFIKDIPIYKESVKPWRVIGRLSNQLVDDALREVVKELEVEPLMSMMYKLEFQ